MKFRLDIKWVALVLATAAAIYWARIYRDTHRFVPVTDSDGHAWFIDQQSGEVRGLNQFGSYPIETTNAPRPLAENAFLPKR